MRREIEKEEGEVTWYFAWKIVCMCDAMLWSESERTLGNLKNVKLKGRKRETCFVLCLRYVMGSELRRMQWKWSSSSLWCNGIVRNVSSENTMEWPSHYGIPFLLISFVHIHTHSPSIYSPPMALPKHKASGFIWVTLAIQHSNSHHIKLHLISMTQP